jgi:hypothetical protein
VALGAGIDGLETSVEWLMNTRADDPHAAGSAAYNVLMQFGTVCGGWQLAQAAIAAAGRLAGSPDDAAFLEAKLVTARFYAEQLMPLADAYAKGAVAGSASTMAIPEDAF